MSPITNGRVLYAAHPTEFLEPGVHTKYVEEQIDLEQIPLKGGVLIKTILLTADPYLRHRMRDASIPSFAPPLTIGQPIDNFGIGIVVRSENPEYASGDHVVGYLNFETYSVFVPKPTHAFKFLMKLTRSERIPLSAYLSTMGMAGRTAYGGWIAFAKEKVKTSKTLFISGGGGTVGTFLIQYVKHTSPHIKIISSAGSPEKLQIMKSAGADVVFDYKQTDTAKVLAEHGPIDIYWDNVAGPTLDAALLNMSNFGLIIACGAISGYNTHGSDVKHFEQVFERSLSIHGFVTEAGEEQQKILAGFGEEVTKLLIEGKMTPVREMKYDGLKEAEKALLDMHVGKNVGKPIIVVSQDY